MKYKTPELTALTPAINAIQSSTGTTKTHNPATVDSIGEMYEFALGYQDWE